MKNVEKNVENYMTIDEFENAICMREYDDDYINAQYEKLHASETVSDDEDERSLNIVDSNFL